MMRTRKHDAKLFGGIGIFSFSIVLLVALMPAFAMMPAQGYGARHSWTEFFHARSAKYLAFVEREDAVSVVVSRDGAIYFDREKVFDSELTDKIVLAVAKGSERRGYLRVDRRARYQDVKKVLEAIRSAHIENVSFVTEEATLPMQ